MQYTSKFEKLHQKVGKRHTDIFLKKTYEQITSTKCRFYNKHKMSIFIPIPKKGNAKECSNYFTIAHISHASKVMLKILQARLQQYMNQEFPDVQAGFRKGRGSRYQITNICGSSKRQKRVPEKPLLLLY